MTSSSSVVSLRQPDTIDDPLLTVLRSGARRLLAQAIEAEADAFLATMKGLQLADGRDRVVRHGHGPERQVQTGIGPVAVQRVRLRDRGAVETGERIRFTSAILPRWASITVTIFGSCESVWQRPGEHGARLTKRGRALRGCGAAQGGWQRGGFPEATSG